MQIKGQVPLKKGRNLRQRFLVIALPTHTARDEWEAVPERCPQNKVLGLCPAVTQFREHSTAVYKYQLHCIKRA